MILGITGSRDWQDEQRVIDYLDYQREVYGEELTIVAGAAKGVDTIAEKWADTHNVHKIILPCTHRDWKLHGKAAGHYRNAEIVKLADAVVAFWRWPSGGTANTIAYAVLKGKHVTVFEENAP
jgi:hypothetical protein